MFKDFDFKELRVDVESLLKPLESKYGIKISAGTIVYDNRQCRLTLGIDKPSNIGEQASFMSMCKEYDFTPRDYRRKLIIDGVEYLFVGFNDDCIKPCNILNTENGKTYKTSESMVLDNFVIEESEGYVSILDL